jgi:hypothetical protein
VEEALRPLEDGETVFLEGRDIRRRARKNPLELLGRGTASRFAHRFLVRFRSPLVFAIRRRQEPGGSFFISAN